MFFKCMMNFFNICWTYYQYTWNFFKAYTEHFWNKKQKEKTEDKSIQQVFQEKLKKSLK